MKIVSMALKTYRKKGVLFILLLVAISIVYYAKVLDNMLRAPQPPPKYPALETEVQMNWSNEEKNDKWIVVTTINYPIVSCYIHSKCSGNWNH
jgi:hypothetical protein